MAAGRPQAPPPCAARKYIPGGSRGTGSPRGPDCASGDSPRPKLCMRRQRAARNGPWLSPHAQSVARSVAGRTVWAATCRRDASLAGEGGQTRRPATAGRQTRRPATAGARFRLPPVAGTSVWPAACRRDVSLSRGMSPDAQSGPTLPPGAQPSQGLQVLA